MSNAFTALIWWVIPAAGLIGALGYVLWVTQFKDKYETETTRSVNQFQKFQGAFREAETVTFVDEDPRSLNPQQKSREPFDQADQVDQADQINQGRDK